MLGRLLLRLLRLLRLLESLGNRRDCGNRRYVSAKAALLKGESGVLLLDRLLVASELGLELLLLLLRLLRLLAGISGELRLHRPLLLLLRLLLGESSLLIPHESCRLRGHLARETSMLLRLLLLAVLLLLRLLLLLLAPVRAEIAASGIHRMRVAMMGRVEDWADCLSDVKVKERRR